MSSAREEPGPTEPAPACLGALCPYPGPPCPPQTTVLGLGANQAVPGRRMSTRTNTGIHAYLSLVSEPVGCPYCLLFCVCLYSQVCNRLFVCLSFHDPVFFLPPSLCVLLSESDVTTGAAGVGGGCIPVLSRSHWFAAAPRGQPPPVPPPSNLQPPTPTPRPGPERAGRLRAQSPARDRSAAAEASGDRFSAHPASQQGLEAAELL